MALSLSTFPYVFLLTAEAFRSIDPSLEEAARGLGASPTRVFRTITIPQLRPALGAGALLSGLYALSDFGAVSLMRYDTFTRAIYAHVVGLRPWRELHSGSSCCRWSGRPSATVSSGRRCLLRGSSR